MEQDATLLVGRLVKFGRNRYNDHMMAKRQTAFSRVALKRKHGVTAEPRHLKRFERLLALSEGKVDAAACHLYEMAERALTRPL